MYPVGVSDSSFFMYVHVVSVMGAREHRPLTNNTNYKYKDGNQSCS